MPSRNGNNSDTALPSYNQPAQEPINIALLLILALFTVPPKKPRITDELNNDATSGIVGPYRIGDTVVLNCVAYGGKSMASFQ